MSEVHPMLAKIVDAIRLHVEADSEIYWAAEYGRPIPVDSLVAIARAAVQALMEPDEGMVEAGALTADTPVNAMRDGYAAMLRPLVEGEGE